MKITYFFDCVNILYQEDPLCKEILMDNENDTWDQKIDELVRTGKRKGKGKPAIKKRVPANCRGVAYSKPIFTPAKAVDHNRQDIIARREV